MRPKREHATNNGQTYMVTSSTWGRRSLFHVDRWAELFVNTLGHYRSSDSNGAAKAVPFEDLRVTNEVGDRHVAPKGATFQENIREKIGDSNGAAKAAPFQDLRVTNEVGDRHGAAKAAPFQSIEIKEPRTR